MLDPYLSRRRRSPSILARFGCLLLGFGLLGITAAGLYRVPAVNDALFWRVEVLKSQIRERINPHPANLPTPIGVPAGDASVVEVLAPTVTTAPSVTLAPLPTSSGPSPAATLRPTAESLPVSASLYFNTHEYQRWNNCGPATLSMGLRYWGWQGTQQDAAPWLKPDRNDKNVGPAELQAYVNSRVDSLQLLYRVGGDLNVLRRLIVGGYPVIVEKGFQPDEEKGWMGHYLLLTGYDDVNPAFSTQDSFRGSNIPVSYTELDAEWQAFNRIFIVVYREGDREKVLRLLGDLADQSRSNHLALQTAQRESARDPGDAFAWHNLGVSLSHFGEYSSAAEAFDQARAIGLPWRMLWYQTEMYTAYFSVGRYAEVMNLAGATLETASNLEESYYWRARARHALGDVEGALSDMTQALQYNPNFEAAGQALQQMQSEG